jgi:hypothetical protein
MQEDDQVAPQDPGLNNSPKGGKQDEADAELLAASECYWNDKKYSDGATVCDSGQRYKCWSGHWVDIGNC